MSHSFLQLIETQCVAQPQAIAIHSNQRDISYAQLWQQVDALRQQLRASGANRIAIALANCAAWIVLDLAAALEGIVVVPVPHFFSPAQLQHLLADSNISLLISEADDTAKPGDYHCLGNDLRLKSIPGSTAISNINVDPDVFKISYTSGTTGDPKGVLISYTQVNNTVDSILKSINARPDYRHLSVLPFSLLLENIVGIYAVLAAGGCCFVPSFKQLGLTGSSNVDWEKFSSVVASTQPQSMITVPALLQGLLHCIQQYALDVSSLEFVAVGGAPISKLLLSQVQQAGLPVFQGYGMTECGSVVCLNTPEQNRIGSVGKPLPHISIRIDEHGEIVIRGMDFPGYANRANSQCNGEWYSGDLGYLDDEGYLFVTARKHSAYSTAFGRNVAPEWVESELECEPVIARASLFGEGRKHNVAVIVAAMPELDNDSLQQAVEQTNKRLPDYARITRWIRAEQPFSAINGQQSAAGTLRREKIYRDYQQTIEPLFTELAP